MRGELSLIGPRPSLTGQVDLIHHRNRFGVFAIRPGITGYGQVNDVDMSCPLELAIQDHRYAALRSISLDLKILIKTATGSGFGDVATASPIQELKPQPAAVNHS